MNGFFHELVAEALRQLPRERAADLILKKVSAQGINLSRRELKRVRAHILNGRSTFRTRSWKFWGRRQFDLEITEAEIRQIESDLKSLTDKPAVDLIDRITDDLSDHLL